MAQAKKHTTSGLFDNQTCFNHLNTKHAWYSDPHYIKKRVLPPMSEKLLSNRAKKRLRMTKLPMRTVAKK